MSDLKIESKKIGDNGEVLVVDVTGSLDAHTVPGFENEMNSLIEQGNFNVLINASKIDYISSAGLGVFMSILDTVEEKGGSLNVLKAPEQFTKVFAMMGFDDLFESYETEDEALEQIIK
jgi:anti-anti-sigma factor